MLKIFRLHNVLLTTLVICLLASAPNGASGQDDSPTFTLSLSSLGSEYGVGSMIRLDIKIQNLSDQLVILSSSRIGGRNTGIRVRKDDGTEILAPNDTEENLRPGKLAIGIGPGKTGREAVDLAKLFKMTDPGKYYVTLHRKDPISRKIVSSNTLEITIVP